MSDAPALFLDSAVVVEPLHDGWHVWPQILPPLSAARNIVHRYLRILDSYVAAPEMHELCTRDPASRGGPFIEIAADRISEVCAFAERMRVDTAEMARLAEALDELEELLAECNGGSLTPLYAKVPEPLRGFVELVYDLDDHPRFRVIEPLLYASPYFRRHAQSLRLARPSRPRPMVLSTPRLPEPGALHLQVPFDDPRVDALFSLDRAPLPPAAIVDALGGLVADPEQIRPFLREAPPRAVEPYRGPGIRWRYFGHACVLVEARGTSLLLDPLVSCDGEMFSLEDLPERIDGVLITHGHQDHCYIETLLRLRHRIDRVVVPRATGGVVDPSLKLMLERIGFPRVTELSDLESARIGAFEVTAAPFLGEHADLAVAAKNVYFVRAAGRGLCFAADARVLEPRVYERVAAMLGRVDVLFVGLECEGAPLSWLYGPLRHRALTHGKDRTRRVNGCDGKEAQALITALGAREVYIYAMGLEPWLAHMMSNSGDPATSLPLREAAGLIAWCHEHGIEAEHLRGRFERELAPVAP